jgi:hypothetical protein
MGKQAKYWTIGGNDWWKWEGDSESDIIAYIPDPDYTQPPVESLYDRYTREMLKPRPTRQQARDMLADTIERLLTMYSHRGDGLPTQYINPDGPDAVATIQYLQAENAALREGLAELLDASATFAEAVRHDTNKAYPWCSFDDMAVPKARALLERADNAN